MKPTGASATPSPPWRADGTESLPSVPVTCEAGAADLTPPHIVLISPPTSALEGAPVWVEARILDNRSHDYISATLHYRVPGARQLELDDHDPPRESSLHRANTGT